MRYEQRIGKHGQNVAAAALSRVGIEMVEQIGTPVKLTPASEHRKDVHDMKLNNHTAITRYAQVL